MPAQRDLPRLVSVGLAPQVVPCGRLAMHAPVVQHVRHVHNLASGFRHTQGEVVILRPIHLVVGQARLGQNVLAHHEPMRDAIVRVQQISVEISLEHRVLERARDLERVLVAVQQARVGMLGDSLDVRLQRVRLQHVVVVEERHVLAPRMLNAGVRVAHDAEVVAQRNHRDAIVSDALDDARHL